MSTIEFLLNRWRDDGQEPSYEELFQVYTEYQNMKLLLIQCHEHITSKA